MDYLSKYMKYKKKYVELQNQMKIKRGGRGGVMRGGVMRGTDPDLPPDGFCDASTEVDITYDITLSVNAIIEKIMALLGK